MPPYSLEEFASQLLEEKGLQNVDPEILDQLREDLVMRMEEWLNVAILKYLPKENIVEFANILEMGNAEGIQEYCETHIENFPNVIATELISFRKRYLRIKK